MARYEDYDSFDDRLDDIRLPRGRRQHGMERDHGGQRPQSGMGMASIGMAGLAFVGYPIVVVLLVMLDANPPQRDDDPLAVLAGLSIMGCLCLNLAGFVVGLVGCFQSDRNPLCAILGTVFNGILLLGAATIVVFGILAGG